MPGIIRGIPTVVVTQHVQGAALGAFTTAKSVINGQAQAPLDPAFWYPGKHLKIEVAGALSNIATTPGTINFQTKLGTLGSPITAFDTTAIQLNATAHTLRPFELEIKLRCEFEGTGTTAKLFGSAKVFGTMFTKTAAQVDGVNTETMLVVPATAPVVGTGFDSTIVNTLDLWAGFSISDPANLVRIDQYLVTSYDYT